MLLKQLVPNLCLLGEKKNKKNIYYIVSNHKTVYIFKSIYTIDKMNKNKTIHLPIISYVCLL